MATNYEDSYDTRKKPKNKLNVFGDDVSVDAASNMLHNCTYRSKNDDTDEDDDTENWDGTKVIKLNKSKDSDTPKPPLPDLSDLATPSRSPYNPSPSIPKSTSLGTSLLGANANTSAFGHNRSSSLTLDVKPKKGVIDELKPSFADSKNEANKQSVTSLNSLNSFSSLSDIDDNQKPKSGRMEEERKEGFPVVRSRAIVDIDDAIGSSRKQMKASDIDKMQKEIQHLQHLLRAAKKERWLPLPIENTLRRILKGESYSLEVYRSLAHKLELIDSAVKSHDGNAVTAAVLLMKHTTSKQIFSRELRQRPTAANHYLHYLKEHFDFTEYIDTLCLLGRTEEAAIFKFKLALPTPEVNLKISKLKDSIRAHFSADPSLSNDTSLVEEYIDLLERQRPIEDSDSKLEAAGRSPIFNEFPRKRSLVDMPVVTTLYYCSLYHFDLSENSLGCPAAIRKRHQISEKQYVWTAVAARAKLKQWKDIESILTAKGWFGGTKMKAVIGYDKIVGILHRNNAPSDILDKYLAMMSDPESRLTLAKKVNCHKAIIDTYASLKDRSSLVEYASKLERYSSDGNYAYDVLNGTMIKWR